MIPTAISALVKTITGKVVVGLTVATMGVGAAAAAGADVPVLSSAEPVEDEESTEEESGEESSEESGEETSEESGEETSEESGEETSEGSGEETSEESGEETSEDDDAEPHGAVVSEFTRTTELEGCQKGQATAAVARGDVDPASESLEDDLAPFIDKCKDAAGDDESEDGEESSEEPGEESDEDVEWQDVRDDARAAFHEAREAFVAACGDDGEAGDLIELDVVVEGESDDDDSDDDELSAECQALKDEWKRIHAEGKAEWKDARDADREERKADREERKADREERKQERADRGNGKGKNKDG